MCNIIDEQDGQGGLADLAAEMMPQLQPQRLPEAPHPDLEHGVSAGGPGADAAEGRGPELTRLGRRENVGFACPLNVGFEPSTEDRRRPGTRNGPHRLVVTQISRSSACAETRE